MNNKICFSTMLKWHGVLLLLLSAFIVDDVLTGLSRVCNVGSAPTKKLLPFVATAAFLDADARASDAKNDEEKIEMEDMGMSPKADIHKDVAIEYDSLREVLEDAAVLEEDSGIDMLRGSHETRFELKDKDLAEDGAEIDQDEKVFDTFSQLRGSASGSPHNLAPPKAKYCEIQAILGLTAKPTDPNDPEGPRGHGPVFVCTMEPEDAGGLWNQMRAIEGDDKQMKEFNHMFANGEIIPGKSRLELGPSFGIGRANLNLPTDFNPKAAVHRDPRRGPPPKHFLANAEHANSMLHSRMLYNVETTGDLPALVVRVTDGNGAVLPQTANEMSDNVFGTNGDPVNLKSQMYGCSGHQVNFIAGDNGSGQVNQELYAAPGVIEVSIELDIMNDSDYWKENSVNAIIAAVQAKLGLTLPGPYQHVLLFIPNVTSSWTAWAYVNNWLSVYKGHYSTHAGILMHEIGHNFNLLDSGKGSVEYGDGTGSMGYTAPLFTDDGGLMCFNPAKNWQLGWYDDRKLLLDITSPDWSSDLVGIADYLDSSSDAPVVIKLETGHSKDYFVGFNRAIGVNSAVPEAPNEVTIIQVMGNNGEGASQSWLKAHLKQGESYSIVDFGEPGRILFIEVTSIDIYTSPGKATVRFYHNGCTSDEDCDALPPISSGIEYTCADKFCVAPCMGKNITVNVTTDNYPEDTGWTLTNTCTGEVEKSVAEGEYSGKATSFVSEICVANDAFEFVISDSHGDGLCCRYGSGSYSVTYDGVEVASGGEFGYSETTEFGSCPIMSPSSGPTTSPSNSPTKSPSSGPTSKPTSTSTSSPTTALSVYGSTTYVGDCLSSSGKRYPRVRIEWTDLGVTSKNPALCAQFCRGELDTAGQHGMMAGDNSCACLFDNTNYPYNGTLPSGATLKQSSSWTGTGPVKRGNSGGATCYPL